MSRFWFYKFGFIGELFAETFLKKVSAPSKNFKKGAAERYKAKGSSVSRCGTVGASNSRERL